MNKGNNDPVEHGFSVKRADFLALDVIQAFLKSLESKNRRFHYLKRA